MNPTRSWTRIWMLLPVLLLSGLLAACGGGGAKDFEITVFHTNDMHSHALGVVNADYDPAATGDGTVGGYARLAAIVEETRSTTPDTLLLDAGDFTMGTLLASSLNTASDLDLLKAMGFDAAAIGNHEFDWDWYRPTLADMIGAASAPTVPLLCANMVFDPTDPADDELEALYGAYGQAGKAIHPYIVKEMPGGARVGIFGLLGRDAYAVSNAVAVTFSPTMEAMEATAQATVDTLREVEKVDLVILLAHLGMFQLPDNTWEGETIDLAKQVEGIDLILSGHTHTVVDAPVAIPCEKTGSSWTTMAIETGCYARHVGRYTVKRSGGQVTVSGGLLAVDDSRTGVATVTTQVEAAVADAEQDVLSDFPQVPEAGAFLDGDYFQPLVSSAWDLTRGQNEASNLIYLVADAVRLATGADLAAISNGGDVRDSLLRGTDGAFHLSDLFIVTPLGMGPDQRIGYPLVTFYLSWNILRMVLEAATVSTGLVNNDYLVVLSGLHIEFDSTAPQYLRIKRILYQPNLDETGDPQVIYQQGAPNDGWLVDPNECVSVAVSIYIARFLASFNLRPMDENCQFLDVPLDDLILRDNAGDEIKLWYSVAGYLAGFGDTLPPQYDPSPTTNPIGPPWRRLRDLSVHP